MEGSDVEHVVTKVALEGGESADETQNTSDESDQACTCPRTSVVFSIPYVACIALQRTTSSSARLRVHGVCVSVPSGRVQDHARKPDEDGENGEEPE